MDSAHRAASIHRAVLIAPGRGRNTTSSPRRSRSPPSSSPLGGVADIVGSQPGALGAGLAPDAPRMPVGTFHYGGVFNGHPCVLGTWLVTSSDASILGQVAELLGGTLPSLAPGHQPDAPSTCV
jgi:hypothetical protein